MTTNPILKQISAYADALKDAAKWSDSDTTIAKVYAKEDVNNGNDYIYEFYCYIRILTDLKNNYTVKFEPGKGAYKSIFPQAPCPKKGKPYFYLIDPETNEPVYQVCAGTQINTEFEDILRAPDISFQKPTASDNPGIDDVLLIIDAKYCRSTSEKNKVAHGQLADVILMIRDLEVEKASEVPINFHEFKSFKGNCLLTNIGAHTDKKSAAYNKKYSIIEVEHFTVDAKFNTIG